MKKKYRELTGNTIIFAIGVFGSKIILFFMVPLYTNILSTSEYGTADLIQTLSSLFVPVFSIMIQDAVLRFGLSEQICKKAVLKNSLYVTCIGSFVALTIIPLFRFYNPVKEWTLFLYGILITNMLSNVLYSYVKVINKNKLYSICGVLSTFILAALNVIFLLIFDMGINGYLLSIIISQIFSCVFLFLGADLIHELDKKSLDKKLMKDMIIYSLPLIANNLSWWILNSSDKLMVEYFCGVNDLGLYTAATKIPALISVINSVFLQAWTISSIKDYEQDKDKSFFEDIFSLYSLVMIGATSFVLLIVKYLMYVYVGVDYQDSWRLVPFLLFGAVFYGYSLFFGTIYSAAKKNIYIALSTAVSALLNIFINLVLLTRIGVIAASISTAFSYVVVGIYRMIDSRRFLKFKIGVGKFTVNSILLFVQVVLITIDRNSFICSLIILGVLGIINREQIIKLPRYVLNRFTK